MIARLLLIFALSSCATTGEDAANSCAAANCGALNEAIDAGGVTVTALQLLEDSRCPINARCVQAGEVRVLALVERSGRQQEVTVSSTESVSALSGMLTLSDVAPVTTTQAGPIAAGDYRFTFNWVPHIADPAGPAMQ